MSKLNAMEFRKSLLRTALLLFSIWATDSAMAQDVAPGKCLLLTQITDFEQIPETDARLVIWNMNDSIGFNKEVVSDIDGKNSFTLDQGEKYAIKIFKSDTSFVFGDIEIPKYETGIVMNYSFQIKIIRSYQMVPPEFQTISSEKSEVSLELDIHFASNSAVIPENDKTALNELYDRLVKYETMRIELASHTDDVGDDESNMRLSQRRSNSVKQYLVEKGIGEARIAPKGYGEKKPKVPNDSPEGRAQNRRTEVRFVNN
jgi:outer membrane protein OmpA-like peptidoglycan-associated protein